MTLSSSFKTPIAIIPVLVSLIILGPVLLAIWFGVFSPSGLSWDHILNNRLLPYSLTTLFMLAVTGMLIVLIAVPLAWLISLFDFPGRKIFEWCLILPLAVPGYVLAYSWANLASVAGPIQSAFRDLTSLSARDYWFPDIFTPAGLSVILALGLFPYVYITARAAFSNQSLATLEAARSLGMSGIRLFFKVAIPAARPAIIAGLALALMEASADYGAADYLGVQTLGVGIIRAWSSYGEPTSAARLALVLIGLAFSFMLIANLAQGKSGVQQNSYRWTTPQRTQLTGLHAGLACLYCISIMLIAFGIPVLRLLWLCLENGVPRRSVFDPVISSIILASAGTAFAFICALTLVLSNHYRQRAPWITRLSAAAGYATPGAVLGLSGLFLLQMLGQSLTGNIALLLLVWIYASRFTAAGTEPLYASLTRAPASLDHAARSLRVGRISRFYRVDLPILSPGALAAGLILFVEILKELPATLMLRPFGWDTLAIRAHAYASDERLAEATLPSLLIVIAGILPVLLLSYQITRSGEALK
ncbi:MAG: ABC transporter permease [Henriciella sp.]